MPISTTDEARPLDDEVSRIYDLPDRWLGVELLRLVREIRNGYPIRPCNPLSDGDIAYLLWHFVPEIARRLGVKSLDPNEATRPHLRTASPLDLRHAAGRYLADRSMSALPTIFRCRGSEILARPVSKGNPLAIAIDRIAPAVAGDLDDWIAKQLRQAWLNRDQPPASHWSPGLLAAFRRTADIIPLR